MLKGKSVGFFKLDLVPFVYLYLKLSSECVISLLQERKIMHSIAFIFLVDSIVFVWTCEVL